MKKSNVILTVLIAVVSVFLLWLWFFLGFNKVDSPLDLVMSVIWWVIVVVGIVLVVKTEKTREEKIRTVYVGKGRFYNSESGVLTLTEGAGVADSIAAVLASLEYGFDRADAPDPDDEKDPADWTHVVRTSEYKPARDSDDGSGEHEKESWEGEVVVVETGRSVPFSSREELAAIIG